MTVSAYTTLPFMPQGAAAVQGADAVKPAGMDSLGRSQAVGHFEDAMRAAGGVDAAQPGVQVAQLTAPVDVNGVAGATATDALSNVSAAQAVTAPPVQAPVASASQGTGVDARARAAEGLDLARPAGPNEVASTASATSGTTILGGLEQLRSVFDGRFNSLGAKLEGTQMDVSSMMALQAEVTQYTVLLDVSSKLAGKSTQAMDSLMKGQ